MIMSKQYCEKVRLSAMAILDGQKPFIAENEINTHISSCNDCKTAIEQLQKAEELLEGKHRKTYEVNIVREVETALSTAKMSPGYSEYSVHFITLSLVLFILKIVGISPALTAAGIAKFLTILVVIAFFILIKQNPFTISPNIQTKGV